MSHQSFPKATGTVTDGYLLTWQAVDGYWSARQFGDGYQHLNIVSGVASNIGVASNTFLRIGSIRIDTSQYRTSASVIFEVIFEATASQTAEIRLYNLTDAAAISGSTLSTSSNTSSFQTAAITLTTGSKIYEVQLRITNGSPGVTDGAYCTNARIRIR